MIPHVVEAKHIGAYRIWLKFNDGLSGEIDLVKELDGPIFEPLNDLDYFDKFSVRYNTISWDNGADFAPEFLWEKVAHNSTDRQKSASR